VDDVDPGLQEFADHVIDRLLGRGAELFPAVEPDIALSGGEVVAAPAPPNGGSLAANVGAAGGQLARARATVRRLDEQSGQVVAAAGETGAGGRSGVELLRAGARTQAAAIMPMANSAAGMRLLVSTLDQRLGTLQQHIDNAKKANVAAAVQLRELAGGYNEAST
jgi:hypothetical protein